MNAFLYTFRDKVTNQCSPIFEVRADSKLTSAEIVSRDVRNNFDQIPNAVDQECFCVGFFDLYRGTLTSYDIPDCYALDKEIGLCFTGV